MLAGNPPFQASNRYVLFKNILYDQPIFGAGFSDTSKNLIAALLEKKVMASISLKIEYPYNL
jgi:hypothetical protein